MFIAGRVVSLGPVLDLAVLGLLGDHLLHASGGTPLDAHLEVVPKRPRLLQHLRPRRLV